MNFKKVALWTTLFTTAIAPAATAQNPVILQGNYVSNVYSLANFIKNPNAQTNVADITATGTASATRSTTTPLYATSEFNVSLNIGATLSWATRNFDEGLKNQQCEARFTYRGFTAGTTTAEVVQNAAVVGSLPLTATATNPIIGSIAFPCGTLAFPTTFRLSQATANTTGTNEIGAIYIGLITDTATQSARIWGTAYWSSGALAQYFNSAEPTGFVATPAPAFAFTTTYGGSGQAPTGANQIGLSIPNLPVGDYWVAMENGFLASSALTSAALAACNFRIRETTTGAIPAISYQEAVRQPSLDQIRDYDRTIVGVFSNSAIATRNFVYEAEKIYDNDATNRGTCGVSAFGTNRPVVFKVEPLFR